MKRYIDACVQKDECGLVRMGTEYLAEKRIFLNGKDEVYGLGGQIQKLAIRRWQPKS